MSPLAGDGWLGFVEEAGGSFWDGEHGIGGAEDAGEGGIIRARDWRREGWRATLARVGELPVLPRNWRAGAVVIHACFTTPFRAAPCVLQLVCAVVQRSGHYAPKARHFAVFCTHVFRLLENLFRLRSPPLNYRRSFTFHFFRESCELISESWRVAVERVDYSVGSRRRMIKRRRTSRATRRRLAGYLVIVWHSGIYWLFG